MTIIVSLQFLLAKMCWNENRADDLIRSLFHQKLSTTAHNFHNEYVSKKNSKSSVALLCAYVKYYGKSVISEVVYLSLWRIFQLYIQGFSILFLILLKFFSHFDSVNLIHTRANL